MCSAPTICPRALVSSFSSISYGLANMGEGKWGKLSFTRENVRGTLKSTRQWHPTPVLWPGKSHGRRSLVGCSPWVDWATSLSLFTFMHWEGNDNPLQCSYLENPRDSGAWWAAIYGVAESRTWLKRLSSSRSTSDLSPISLSTNLLMVCVFIWDRWALSHGHTSRQETHKTFENIFNLTPVPFLQYPQEMWQTCRSPFFTHLIPNSKSVEANGIFHCSLRPHTSRWDDLCLFPISTPLVSPNSEILGACLKPSKHPSGE